MCKQIRSLVVLCTLVMATVPGAGSTTLAFDFDYRFFDDTEGEPRSQLFRLSG